MECEKVQDLLINEYTDKELEQEEHSEVERHMVACLDCRDFFAAVQRSAVIPFNEVGEMKPDSVVWQRLEEKIETERAHSWNGFGRLSDALALLLRIPQPVFRVAFATALILGVVVFSKWPSSYAGPAYGYISEQMAFMGQLETGNPDPANGDFGDDAVVLEETGA